MVQTTARGLRLAAAGGTVWGLGVSVWVKRNWTIGLIAYLAAVCGSAYAQQEVPSAPEPQISQEPAEKKDKSGNPVEMTRKMTVQAAQATIHMGEAAMVRARDWEASWVTGVFVEKDHVMLPLTFAQRRELYLDQTLTTPGAYMKRMFAAGIDQARGSPSQWQGGIGGFGERFASREGQFITANTFAMLGNAALRYEPRYDQCNCQRFWPRTKHAILRNFLTYDHSEQDLRPQFGLYAGSFLGGMVSSAWKPHPRNAFAEGGRAMLGQAGYGSLLNFFIEFAGDINHKIGARRRENR